MAAYFYRRPGRELVVLAPEGLDPMEVFWAELDRMELCRSCGGCFGRWMDCLRRMPPLVAWDEWIRRTALLDDWAEFLE